MKKFNKNAALNKLSNKNNSKTKKRAIIISIIVLVIGIIYFSFARFESSNTYSLISGTIVNKTVLLSDKMIDLKSKGSTDLEYDGTATLGVNGTEDNNLRYVGATPNNYVYFNCSTTNPSEMNDTTCEKWRVIGLFNNIEDNNGNSASRVKIIRYQSLGDYSWDTTESSINRGYGINQWGPSGTYEGADLMRELNTDYLGNITVGTDSKWYSGSGNNKTASMPTSTLNSNAQNMIQEVKWNIGSNGSNGISTWTTKNMYTYERSENTGKICSSGINCNDSEIRTTTWIGKVALMYPSDYGYATSGETTTNRVTCLTTSMYNWNSSEISDCKNNDWILSSYQWTLSPEAYIDGARALFYVAGDGCVSSGNVAYGYEVRPVVFLKSDITITEGNGSSEKPYKIHKPTISETIKSLKTNGSTELEYDGTEDNNLRYVGTNPNNYVEFNGELWRIIGVMNNIEKEDGTTESLVKIRRAESLGNYSWDTSESSINGGYGINQWGASDTYEGADLMRELNTDYLGNITVGTNGKWYNGLNNSKTANMSTSTLSANAQSMIETVKWNLGSPSNNNGTYDSSWQTNIMSSTSYTRERANTNGKFCTSGTSCNDTVNRTSTWTGKVGLIYPSDYGYATSGGTTTNRATCLTTTMYKWYSSEVSNCKNNDWILSSNQWTLSLLATPSGASYVYEFRKIGDVSNNSANGSNAVFPVVFLKSSISITGGNGSSTNPYSLG